MMKPAYIRGLSALSPQQTFRANTMPVEIVSSDNNRLKCIEPSYGVYLNPVMARRMGRVIKMGVAAAMEALSNAGVEMPGAIITGTALGNLGDTEKFLTSVIKDDEQFLTPTNFIQSLQNTVSAQIALQLKCMNHNFTFVHKGFSFESAVLDAMMLLNDGEADRILAGGLDEMTDHNHHIYSRLGIWKKEMIPSGELLKHTSAGTIAGEGSTFFVLCSHPNENDYAVIKGIRTIYEPESANQVVAAIITLLSDHHSTLDDLSLVLWGFNGDEQNDTFLKEIKNKLPSKIPSGFFKHLCGEYQTSSAFATWIAAVMLKQGAIPDYVLTEKVNTKAPKNILICNNYENNFSLLLISTS